jgi:hypothetical protein
MGSPCHEALAPSSDAVPPRRSLAPNHAFTDHHSAAFHRDSSCLQIAVRLSDEYEQQRLAELRASIPEVFDVDKRLIVRPEPPMHSPHGPAVFRASGRLIACEFMLFPGRIEIEVKHHTGLRSTIILARDVHTVLARNCCHHPVAIDGSKAFSFVSQMTTPVPCVQLLA